MFNCSLSIIDLKGKNSFKEIKLKRIPLIGEYITFDNCLDYYKVTKIIHNIDLDFYVIWIIEIDVIDDNM